MAKLKSTYALQQKADEFDVYDLIDEIEEDILEDDRRGYGEWQNYVLVSPNFPEVRKTLSNIEPIVKGRCWLVYERDEIANNQQNELEDDEWFFIDYITMDDFKRRGIEL